MNTFRKIFLVLIAGLVLYFSFEVYQQERETIRLKNDLIELSKINYGLFNVDEWKVILADIISKKVEELNFDGSNKEAMRTKIENLLTTAIDEFEDRYYEEKSKTLGGIFRSGVAKVTGTFDHIKKDIPEFTDQILNFLNEKENRQAIKGYLTKQLNEYADNTFSKTDYSKVSTILSAYEVGDLEKTRIYLQSRVESRQSEGAINKTILLCLALICILFIVIVHKMEGLELILLLILSSLFLCIGVLLPMIEIDARISEMNFSLLGESVQFTDQVLYYKSKSILEVVELMIFQQRIDLLAVGLLVLTFSVLFPILKLICSTVYSLKKSSRHNPFISFMVFKSGKWSMADVMVIAIFMAYIGFDGIISEQLKQLESITHSMDLLTTNKSNLLFGFFSFTIFVIMSLAISQKIQNQHKTKTE